MLLRQDTGREKDIPTEPQRSRKGMLTGYFIPKEHKKIMGPTGRTKKTNA